jgi:hypothetical protein
MATKQDAVNILAQAADDTRNMAAWRTIMNAIFYLRSGQFPTVRAPGITRMTANDWRMESNKTSFAEVSR